METLAAFLTFCQLNLKSSISCKTPNLPCSLPLYKQSAFLWEMLFSPKGQGEYSLSATYSHLRDFSKLYWTIPLP